jgi:hypothetical protein
MKRYAIHRHAEDQRTCFVFPITASSIALGVLIRLHP